MRRSTACFRGKATNNAYHIPVLVEETLWALACEGGKIFVDATGGGGGHTRAILEATRPDGRVVAFDRDEEAVEELRRSLADFGDRLMVVHENFSAMPKHLPALGLERVDGFLFDFGVSHHQLRSQARGFSFMHDGPLDMRMDRRQAQNAATLVNEATEETLCRILRTYGEEPRARRIARAIVAARKGKRIRSTLELARIVAAAKGGARRRIHPATKTFQALRIAVNGELEAISTVLPQLPRFLSPNGRICTISFHSLEDRIVKRTFRSLAQGCICPPGLPRCCCNRKPLLRIVTKKPIQPRAEEIERNPLARSARLRTAARV